MNTKYNTPCCTLCFKQIDHPGWCESCAKVIELEREEKKRMVAREKVETVIDLIYEQRTWCR